MNNHRNLPPPSGKNRLAAQTSPYLQQHAANPVDWYPWGEAALARARAENKPILLSIGYSACHWCHVMAHESFEDEAVAAVMNAHFVNIKVDREERPDIDQIYQLAHQMLTRRSGGWPLTMFLTPDQAPFFGGTYFPKEPRYNLPGFVQIMERVLEAYRTRRQDVDQQNNAVVEAIANQDQHAPNATATLTRAPLDRAVETLCSSFDATHGGFGKAPKFPHPTNLALLLRAWHRSGDPRTLQVVAHTLARMAEGGIYDQVGGGFCRYSVDARWEIPHFEKMLYDNGPLLALYADAWTATRLPLFARIVDETAAWLMREMQSPGGGYYSSLDADSEGEEGKYYVWTQDDVRDMLTADELAVVRAHWGLDGAANFEQTHWHLRVARSREEVAAALHLTTEACDRKLATAREKLFTAREQRVRPGRDEKILTSWNGLTIAAMAHAARVFDRADWHDSARRAFEFVRTTLLINGRLVATYKDGHAHLNAYLDDYAFMIDAAIELMQVEFRADDLAFANTLGEVLLDHFEDRLAGGFFFTSHDHERLIQRPKVGVDNATPSGNGVAAFALNRLGHLTGRHDFIAATERTIRAFYDPLEQQPTGFAMLLTALAEVVEPTRMVVNVGSSVERARWRTELSARYRPDLMIIGVAPNTAGLPDVLIKPAAPGDGVNAYVCQGVTCSAPVDDLVTLRTLLDKPIASA